MHIIIEDMATTTEEAGDKRSLKNTKWLLINFKGFFMEISYICKKNYMKQDRIKIPILTFVSILFIVLLNFPILSTVNKPLFFMGFPILYFYIFSIWIIFILSVIWIINKKD